MKLKFLTFAIIIRFVTAKPPDEYKINDGASTSHASELQELTDGEKWELDDCAESIVGMTFADDLLGGDLWDMITNRYDELESYASFIEAFYNFAKYGTNFPGVEDDPYNLLTNYKERLHYLHRKVDLRIQEILYQACETHFHQEYAYIYNWAERTFVLFENTMVNSERCICAHRSSCGAANLQRKTTRTLRLRAGKKRPSKFLQVNQRANNPNNARLSQHHIIPVGLIARFFQIWWNSARSSPGGSQSSRFDGCSNILLGRLERSIKKVMVHKMRKINEAAGGDYSVNYRISRIVNDHNLIQLFEILLTHSNGGNIIVGPSERGPLDPSFGRIGDDAFEAFEVDCEPIIGTERYQEMLSLHRRLLFYVRNAPTSSTFDIMRNGLELFTSMVIMFEEHPITLMNDLHWVRRRLTPAELSRLSPELQSAYRYRLFWDIKKSNHRSSRSLPVPVDKCDSVENVSRRRWDEFIVRLLRSSLEAENSNRTTSWSCTLTRLYFDYKFLSPTSYRLDGPHANFETHLHTVISRTSEWQECIGFDGPAKLDEWCLSWRRIMLNYEVNIDGHDDFKDFKSAQFHRDTQVFVDWLLVQVSKYDNSSESGVGDRLVSKKSEIILCYNNANKTHFGCPNQCSVDELGDQALSNKLLYLSKDESYNQEWFKDVDNKLKCRCSNDRSEIVSDDSNDCSLPRNKDKIRCTELR